MPINLADAFVRRHNPSGQLLLAWRVPRNVAFVARRNLALVSRFNLPYPARFSHFSAAIWQNPQWQ
jgi:hypothetical protein